MKRDKVFSIPRFLFELFIVFIGVYGAFELNRYQQNQRENQIKENYFISFRSELQKLVGAIRQTEIEIDRELSELENYSDSLSKEPFIPIYLVFKESLLITQAGFNDDIFIQLDPGLASSLTGGYDDVKKIESMVDFFNQASRQRIYGLNRGDLYDRSNDLRPEFVWYRTNLLMLKKYLSAFGEEMETRAVPAVEAIVQSF